MALDKAGLKAALLAGMNNADPNKTKDAIAQEWADAIDAFVKTATVTTTVAVTSVSGVTTGPGASGPGAGSGTGTLS